MVCAAIRDRTVVELRIVGEKEDLHWLRREWARLKEQDAVLRDQHQRLVDSADRIAIREYVERLHLHQLDLATFHRALHRFHEHYGRDAGL